MNSKSFEKLKIFSRYPFWREKNGGFFLQILPFPMATGLSNCMKFSNDIDVVKTQGRKFDLETIYARLYKCNCLLGKEFWAWSREGKMSKLMLPR